jgi:hypothetical protein
MSLRYECQNGTLEDTKPRPSNLNLDVLPLSFSLWLLLDKFSEIYS